MTSSILEPDASPSSSSSPPNNSNNASTTSPSTTVITIWDGTHYPSPPKACKLSVSLQWTAEEFRDKVAEELGYSKDALELKCCNVLIEPAETRTLEAIGVGAKVGVYLSRKVGSKDEDFKGKKPFADGVISPSFSSPPSSTSTALVPYGPANYNGNSSSSSSSNYSSSSNWNYSRYNKPAGRSSTGFVGLSNQGATCYMNSLIQTLYMTPEFRSAVYKWSFEDKYKRDKEREKEKEKEKEVAKDGKVASPAASSSDADRLQKEKTSIALQLQRLFGRLQLCDVQAAKTKDLTKSFGWEDADAFTQHDVQELCRVLFDALEKNFAGTDQANFVNELYQGKMKDYVQCKECGYESARSDDYLDIPLVIRGFGETRAVESVEEALHKFVQPETLDGDNQYKCEKCAKKVDATKGLKFVRFPYLLTLQLKRFDFDPIMMRRTKLNDRVTFPHYLDLNPFVASPTGNEERKPTTASNYASDHAEQIDLDDDIDSVVRDGEEQYLKRRKRVDGEEMNGHDNANGDVDDFEGPPPVPPTADRPYIYELFSVLIHRGSTMGGHYYAYIKSFASNKWYEFNDSHVSEISTKDIRKAFGGDEETPSYSAYSSMYRSTFKSTSNAYMLMYRQVVPEKNLAQVPDKSIPQSARDIIESETQQAKDKRETEEKEKEMVKLKVHYMGGIDLLNGPKDVPSKDVNVHKSTTLADATKQAAEVWGLSEKFAAQGPSCMRLRGFAVHNELPTDTYSGVDNKTMEELRLYTGMSYSNTKYMLLETREPDEDAFREYDPTEILFRITKYDVKTNAFSPIRNVYVSRSDNFLTLREAIETSTGVPIDKQRIFKESASGSIWNTTPTIDEVTLADEYMLRGSKISEPETYYVEYCDDIDSPSPAKVELERIKNLIEVKFNVPDKPEGTPEASVTVDKNMTIKEFREKIHPIVGLGLDEFKIKRPYTFPQLYELTSETDTLADCLIKDGMSLVIEKGRPMKEGEILFNLFMLEPEKETENITELFEIVLDENLTIAELKKQIAARLQEELNTKKNEKVAGPVNINDNSATPMSPATPESESDGPNTLREINPEYLRLREIQPYTLSNKRIAKILPNDMLLRKAVVSSKKLAVQILSEPETATDRDIGIYIQQFKPSTYGLSKKSDCVVREDMPIEDFKASLAQKYGIPVENVGISVVSAYTSFYDDPDVLEIPKFTWDRPLLIGSRGVVNDLHLRNGGLLLVRDNTEPLKELTKEEQDAIEKEFKKKVSKNLLGTSTGFWNRKEKALKIHTAE